MWSHQWLPRSFGGSSYDPYMTHSYCSQVWGSKSVSGAYGYLSGLNSRYSSTLQEEGLKSLVQWYTNHEHYMASREQIQLLVDFAEDESKRKIILAVLKDRLDLGWPYNYKALDVLSALPPSYLIDMLDKLKHFEDPHTGIEGYNCIKDVAKFVEKVRKAKEKKDKDELEKKQKEMLAMWGPLWTNTQPLSYPAHLCFPTSPQPSLYYPYTPPTVPTVSWESKAPSGWTSYVPSYARSHIHNPSHYYYSPYV